MSVNDHEWARSYACQALSDLDAREKLALAAAAKCHRLHFLQMAAEKVCKAYLTVNNGHVNVRRTHACVERNLPMLARQFCDVSLSSREMLNIRRLAKEIEVLAPACDGGDKREDNCEYPWQDGHGAVRIPCEYKFPKIDDGEREITRLIRLIRTAAESYAKP